MSIGLLDKKSGIIVEMLREYLVDTSKREQEAISTLMDLPLVSKKFFGSLGLNSFFSWYLLNIKMDRLVSSMTGDIDILAGRLNWNDPRVFEALVSEEKKNNPEFHPCLHYNFAAVKLAEAGGIKWPPTTDYLVGIEAKCSYYDLPTGTIKSPKSSPKKIKDVQSQVERLLKMGFDKVALLDIIANPPAYSQLDGQAWPIALNRAIMSKEKFEPIRKKRLQTNSPAGHYVWSVGSVQGGDESMRGAGAPIQLKMAQENPLLQGNSETQSLRREMENRLSTVFSNFPQPRRFPVVFFNCATCRTILLR